MTPSLIIIAGSLKGTTFALSAPEVSIGREASNPVCVNEPAVSRRHCLIRQADGQCTLVDLDSYNGTFVNGVPVHEQPLAHGDQIAVGDTLLLFLLHEPETQPPTGPLLSDEDDLITRSTLRLQRADALYLHPDKVLAALAPADRLARDLNALLQISRAVNSVRDRAALQRQLLAAIMAVIPAERGAILLVDERGMEFVSSCGQRRGADADEAVRVSRTITNQVLHEGVALLSNDIMEQQFPGGAESLVAARVRSLLCVPLVVYERKLGVVYLDTGDPAARFDESHLQLLTAVAAIAAVALERAQHIEQLAGENERLHQELNLQHALIGESEPMRAVYEFIAKAAPTDATVLIHGESGTGKELAAHALHQNSPRATKPFVAINCAALTESLLESELFGHERGAFTGAIAQKKGKLEIASGGTVFLDEVGELAPAIQAKLLRVLQAREFERVGGTRVLKVDVRVVAATNKDLAAAVHAGGFRADLYYRLNVLALTMPPLRARRADITLLASYFAAEYGRKVKRRISGVAPETRACLLNYDWPGNVRELANAIERAVVLGTTDTLRPEDLPEAVLEAAAPVEAQQRPRYYEAVREAKKQLIRQAIADTSGNYAEAARLLGIHPNNLHRLMRNMKLKEARES